MHENLSHRLLPKSADRRAQAAALEAFISKVLVDAGLWDAWMADGVRDFRVVEDGPARARICGELRTIDQTLHVFFVDVSATEHAGILDWSLFHDLQAGPRRTRNAVYLIDSPDQDAWAAKFSGHWSTPFVPADGAGS